MIWNSIGEFLHMGGYALYVWSSYIAVVLGLVVEPLLAQRRQHKALLRIKQPRKEQS
jgi:heme exporter protein D